MPQGNGTGPQGPRTEEGLGACNSKSNNPTRRSRGGNEAGRGKGRRTGKSGGRGQGRGRAAGQRRGRQS